MDNIVDKGTSGYEGKDRITLWQPIIKSADSETGYAAILTDDSIDREEDIMGKSALMDFVAEKDYLAGLINHDNDVLNQVCAWINRRIVTVEGKNAVIAEPKFFLSNPKAAQLKGMLDEGAQIGVSIGAIVKDSTQRKIGNKTYREFTKVEPIEASFVAVPANKHAHAIAISKSLNKKTEVPSMDTQPAQVDVELTKKLEAEKESLDKALAEKAEAYKKLEEEKAELAKQLVAAMTAQETATKELAELKEKASKVTLMKGADVGYSDSDMNAEKQTETALKSGKLPIIRT